MNPTAVTAFFSAAEAAATKAIVDTAVVNHGSIIPAIIYAYKKCDGGTPLVCIETEDTEYFKSQVEVIRQTGTKCAIIRAKNKSEALQFAEFTRLYAKVHGLSPKRRVTFAKAFMNSKRMSPVDPRSADADDLAIKNLACGDIYTLCITMTVYSVWSQSVKEAEAAKKASKKKAKRARQRANRKAAAEKEAAETGPEVVYGVSGPEVPDGPDGPEEPAGPKEKPVGPSGKSAGSSEAVGPEEPVVGPEE